MSMSKRPNLRLFTGDQYESFVETLVDDFISARIKADTSLSDMDIINIKNHFEAFLDFCAEHASDKVVLDNGKMTPFVSSR